MRNWHSFGCWWNRPLDLELHWYGHASGYNGILLCKQVSQRLVRHCERCRRGLSTQYQPVFYWLGFVRHGQQPLFMDMFRHERRHDSKLREWHANDCKWILRYVEWRELLHSAG